MGCPSRTQCSTMGDTLLKTLHSIITGVRATEDFCQVVVTSAVEDVLLCVARDYGHDYATLLKKYKNDVVRRHVSGTTSDVAACAGVTKTGKKCGKRAVLHGYCQRHAVEAAEEAAKRRKVQAYQATVGTKTDIAHVLCGPIVPSDKYMVRMINMSL